MEIKLTDAIREAVMEVATQESLGGRAEISGYSFWHNHCGQPMIKVKIYFPAPTVLKYLGFNHIQMAAEFFCANPGCSFHSGFYQP